jgi:hypothetical protein
MLVDVSRVVGGEGNVQQSIIDKHVGGDPITVLDCLDFWLEKKVLPMEDGREYKDQCLSKYRLFLRSPLVFDGSKELPLDELNQSKVDEYVQLRRDRELSVWWKRVNEATRKRIKSKHYANAKPGGRTTDRGDTRTSTIRGDLQILVRAINYAIDECTYRPEGSSDRIPCISYNPFGTRRNPRIRFPEQTEPMYRPQMTSPIYTRLLGVAEEIDDRRAQRYRHMGGTPPPSGWVRFILTLAKESNRRRAALARAQVGDLVTDPSEIARLITQALGQKAPISLIEETFPFGVWVWPAMREFEGFVLESGEEDDTGTVLRSDKKGYFRIMPVSSRLYFAFQAYIVEHPLRHEPKAPLFPHPFSPGKPITDAIMVQLIRDALTLVETSLRDYQRDPGDAWNMFRRWYRTMRQRDYSDNVVAYCGGWLKLSDIRSIGGGVSSEAAMNVNYLRAALEALMSCMEFDHATADEDPDHVPGVSRERLLETRASIERALARMKGT